MAPCGLTQIVNVQAGSSGCFRFVQPGPDRQPSRCGAPLTQIPTGQVARLGVSYAKSLPAKR